VSASIAATDSICSTSSAAWSSLAQWQAASSSSSWDIPRAARDPQVIVELKAVDRIDSIHEAQLLSYLKLSGHPVGLLINFNVRLLKEGLRRLVLGLKE
jgi:PD-(D/E)XK nuclease superfamily